MGKEVFFYLSFFFLECPKDIGEIVFVKNDFCETNFCLNVYFLKIQNISWDKKVFSPNFSLPFWKAEKMIAAESFFSKTDYCETHFCLNVSFIKIQKMLWE